MDVNSLLEYEQSHATNVAAQQAQASVQHGQDAETVQAAASGEGTTSTADDTEYQAVLAKLNSGQQLSSSEIAVLRSKNPARYAQALEAQNARTGLRETMEKNPSGATQAARDAIAAAGEGKPGELLNAASGGMDDDTRQTVSRALDDEYRRYANKYDQVAFSQSGANAMAVTGEEEA